MRPAADYLVRHSCEHQPDLFIDASMRGIAVSWLVEVCVDTGLHQETLFLATSLLDRFLSVTTVRDGRTRAMLGFLHALRSLTVRLLGFLARGRRASWLNFLSCSTQLKKYLSSCRENSPSWHLRVGFACTTGRPTQHAAAGERGLRLDRRQA